MCGWAEPSEAQELLSGGGVVNLREQVFLRSASIRQSVAALSINHMTSVLSKARYTQGWKVVQNSCISDVLTTNRCDNASLYTEHYDVLLSTGFFSLKI